MCQEVPLSWMGEFPVPLVWVRGRPASLRSYPALRVWPLLRDHLVTSLYPLSHLQAL